MGKKIIKTILTKITSLLCCVSLVNGSTGRLSTINSSTFVKASFAMKDTQSESQNQFFPHFYFQHPNPTSKIDEHDENFLDDDFSGSGALGLTQIDRYFNDDSLTTMIQRIQSLSYHYEGRLQLHLIGGFSDNRRISHNLSIALLRKKITMFEKHSKSLILQNCKRILNFCAKIQDIK